MVEKQSGSPSRPFRSEVFTCEKYDADSVEFGAAFFVGSGEILRILQRSGFRSVLSKVDLCRFGGSD